MVSLNTRVIKSCLDHPWTTFGVFVAMSNTILNVAYGSLALLRKAIRFADTNSLANRLTGNYAKFFYVSLVMSLITSAVTISLIRYCTQKEKVKIPASSNLKTAVDEAVDSTAKWQALDISAISISDIKQFIDDLNAKSQHKESIEFIQGTHCKETILCLNKQEKLRILTAIKVCVYSCYNASMPDYSWWDDSVNADMLNQITSVLHDDSSMSDYVFAYDATVQNIQWKPELNIDQRIQKRIDGNVVVDSIAIDKKGINITEKLKELNSDHMFRDFKGRCWEFIEGTSSNNNQFVIKWYAYHYKKAIKGDIIDKTKKDNSSHTYDEKRDAAKLLEDKDIWPHIVAWLKTKQDINDTDFQQYSFKLENTGFGYKISWHLS